MTYVCLWKGVGNFIHLALQVSEDDVCPEDIEDIEEIVPLPANPVGAGNLRDEVLVTFFDERKRDLLLSGDTNLSSYTDGNGKPTAGLRLEVPTELMDTFRLLARFGTRVRARHGEGTKRHIKFDYYEASLYINVKLPGDEVWSCVSPAMAKADLDACTRAETAGIMKQIASGGANSSALSGPRQRLAKPPGRRKETVPAAAPPPGPCRREWTPRPPRQTQDRLVGLVREEDGISQDDARSCNHGLTINDDENVNNAFFLANARSLAPKFTSFLDMFRELDCSFSCITEIWFKDGKQLEQELVDVEMGA